MKKIIRDTINILNAPERKKLTVLVVLNVIIACADILSLAGLVFIIALYTGGANSVHVPESMQWIADKNSLVPVALFAGIFAAKSIGAYFVHVIQYRYAYNVAGRLSQASLLKYLRGNYNDYVHIDSSVHVRRIMHQPIEFGHYVLMGILQIASQSILALLTVIAIVLFNAKLFLLLATILIPAVVLVSIYTKRKLKLARAQAKSSSEKALQYLHESLSGFIESNIYNKSDFFSDRYDKRFSQMTRNLSDLETVQGLPSRLIEIFAVLGLFLIVWFNSGHQTTINVINIGAFMAAAYKIIPGIVKIFNATGQIKTYEYTVNDLRALDGNDSIATEKPDEAISSVSFRNIHFRHNDKSVLNGFDLHIKKGEIVGIAGASGKGKTTLINLLLGFLSQEQGEILFNDRHTDPIKRRGYWQQIAYVQQRPFLLYDTIQSNITLGEETTVNNIIQSAEAAGLADFLQLPEELHTTITENGKNISGGQRQRIALARALYKNSNLIILDEPFSEIDQKLEGNIIKHLKSLSQQGKMILLITHKHENLEHCDKTYTIE